MSYRKIISMLVDNAGYTVVRVAPLLAALPALAKMLEASGYTINSWLTVLGIELTGYALGELVVRGVRNHVLTWRQALLPLGVYGVVIEGMLLGYDTVPTWAAYMAGTKDIAEAVRAGVSIFLPFFTLAGAGMLAFHEYLEELQRDKEYDKETDRERDRLAWEDDRDYKRAEREAKLSVKLSKSMPRIVSSTVTTPTESFHESFTESIGKQIVRYLIENPGAKLEDIAGHVGRSVPSISKEVVPLVDSGVLHAVKEGRRKILTVNGEHEKYLAT